MGLIGEMIKTNSAEKMTAQQITALQKQKLSKLVTYARANSPYYRELYKNIGEDYTLEQLPPTSKPEMMKNLDRKSVV